MTLQIGEIRIRNVGFDRKTKLVRHNFVLDKEALTTFLYKQDSRMINIEVHIARPGEPTRIICVKDVVEPRCKISGDVPGIGRVHVLKNMTLITCGKIVGYQEGIIDMSGPGAAYSPFSKTHNVVLEIDVQGGLSAHEHEEVVRTIGLAAAGYIADAGRRVEPDYIHHFSFPGKDSAAEELPRIAYVYPLLTQGLLHDNYLHGRNSRDELPQVIDPLILLDGAIVSGNCVSACDKNTTYHHQNNPVLNELFLRHGKTLHFAGVVLTSERVRLAAKERVAKETIELVKKVGADGVILSKEGFGNPDADQMMLIRGLEQAGIKCCGLTDEFAGVDGASQSLADVTPEADAMISVGNANERILLPPMTRMIGPVKDLSKLAGGYPQSVHDDGSLEIELQGIIGATNELGLSNLSCREV